ncbi:MAG TPA: Ig-like domain-containing protein, partial [Baekduia sp.]|nr:Ig-like domain-containing protein [Baekduia sp.]
MVGACLALGALAAPAHATTLTIDGSPLNVSADDTGLFQVTFDGSPSGEVLARPNGVAYAGLSAALTVSLSNGNFTAYGAMAGNQFQATAGSPPTLTGSGVDGDPFVVTSDYDAFVGTLRVVHVTGRVSYVNGSPDVTVSYTVTNVQAQTTIAAARLFAAGDLVVAGNDSGTGAFGAGPPREVGAVHPLLLGYDRLLEITPWTHFQEATLSVIQNAISNPLQSVQGMADTVDPNRVDTAAGAQWNFANLAPMVPVVVSARWRFARTSPLVLVAATATQTLGQTAVVNVTARTGDGSPAPGNAVRYSIVGANPGSGAVTTDGNGTAAITWTGTKVGTDTLTAFVDRDGNGLRDVNSEPQSTATVIWAAVPPPVPGKSVVVKVVSGTVSIKRVGSARAAGPAKGFVPFTGAANIPVGSQLDTSKGRVELTSAADTAGKKTQRSQFYDGIFQVKQSVPKKKPKKARALITDLV